MVIVHQISFTARSKTKQNKKTNKTKQKTNSMLIADAAGLGIQSSICDRNLSSCIGTLCMT